MKKNRKIVEVGGYRFELKQEGPTVVVRVKDKHGEKAEWLCSRVNEKKEIAYTTDEDLLALDGLYEDQSLRWKAYERMETDAAFRRVAMANGFSGKHWRAWKAEEDAKEAAKAVRA